LSHSYRQAMAKLIEWDYLVSGVSGGIIRNSV
jgi:hypothetical protein